MINLTLLYVGTNHCGNCLKFKPEWEELTTMVKRGSYEIPGVELSLEELVVSEHSALPLALQNTVTFYPFIMLLPSSYYQTNKDEELVLVGEAMYTYRRITDGVLQYRLGNSVNDSPNMRYPRTSEGIIDWIKTCGIESLKALSPRYYNNMSFEIDDNNRIQMRAIKMENIELEMFIAPLNKEYRVVPGGMVMCRRLLNVHS
jgi:hypothetical protein